MDYLGEHNHNTRYYKKIEQDSYFWSTENDGSDSGLDADKLEGTEGDSIASGVDNGIIGFWYGTLSNFTGKLLTGYPNWHIADGSDGSMDLTDLFPIGASAVGSGYQVGYTIGSNTFKPAGTAIISTHILTIEEIMHTHSLLDYRPGAVLTTSNAWPGNTMMGYWTSRETITSSIGSGQGHDHPATFVGNESSLLPPFLALIPIQYGTYSGGSWSP
jgi:hypothetical protein